MRLPFGTASHTLGTNATGTNDQYVADTVQDGETLNVEKAVEAGLPPVVTTKHPVDDDSEHISTNAQDGVQKMQATTSVWSRNHLIAAYVLMWIIGFTDALQQGATGLLVPYVTSDFNAHSLTAYTYVMSGIIGGVLKLPLAKVLDIWGRPQGYLAMVVLLTLGLVMMAACNNVQTFAAAQIFYWMGYNGLSYTLGIFVADTSSLKNRGFMFGFISSPYIITVWIQGPVADALLAGIGWRWGFGIWTFLQLLVCMPLYFLFVHNYKKAVKAGLIVPTKSDRTFIESVKYYAIEFDVGGLLLLIASLVFFLLPFSIFSFYPQGYKAPICIAFWVVGIVLGIAFAAYEKYVAPKTFIPYELLSDRTIVGACILSAVFFVSWYIWHNFFASFLQVVNGLSVVQTNYVLNIYSIGACFWSLVVGLAIRLSGRFKWIALYFGLPVSILGVGLLVHFRQPDVHIGYIVMCQIFIAFGGGAIVITEQVAAMAATDHQHVAVVLALEGMFSSIGGGIGSSIASAVWQSIYPQSLTKYLPEEAMVNHTMIYNDIVTQLSYPKGTETRYAIERAYGDAQKWMNVGGTIAMLFGIPAVLIWRNIKVKDYKQVKGRVA